MSVLVESQKAPFEGKAHDCGPISIEADLEWMDGWFAGGRGKMMTGIEGFQAAQIH